MKNNNSSKKSSIEKIGKKNKDTIEDELEEYSRHIQKQILTTNEESLLNTYSEQLVKSIEEKSIQPLNQKSIYPDNDLYPIIQLQNKALEYFKNDFHDKDKYKVLLETLSAHPDLDFQTCFKLATEDLFFTLIKQSIVNINNKILKYKKYKKVSFKNELKNLDEIKSNFIITSISTDKSLHDITYFNELDKLYSNSKKLGEKVNEKVKTVRTIDNTIQSIIIALSGIILTIILSLVLNTLSVTMITFGTVLVIILIAIVASSFFKGAS